MGDSIALGGKGYSRSGRMAHLAGRSATDSRRFPTQCRARSTIIPSLCHTTDVAAVTPWVFAANVLQRLRHWLVNLARLQSSVHTVSEAVFWICHSMIPASHPMSIRWKISARPSASTRCKTEPPRLS